MSSSSNDVELRVPWPEPFEVFEEEDTKTLKTRDHRRLLCVQIAEKLLLWICPEKVKNGIRVQVKVCCRTSKVRKDIKRKSSHGTLKDGDAVMVNRGRREEPLF